LALEQLTNAPQDFDFAVGDWSVKHRRLADRLVGCVDWIEFDGRMSTHMVLGGFGNVEDNLLHLPDGAYRALALRSFNPQTKQWSIWWLDARLPAQIDVPVVGQFENGVGTFYADDSLNGVPIRIRFIWSSEDPNNSRWEQAFSSDGGATWETNWTMAFSRA
jgi:hypothetical protein